MGSLLDATESFEEPDDDEREAFADKAATWKLALYWSTNRRFWSCSKPITEGIDPNDHTQDRDVRQTVRWCSLDSVQAASEREIRDDLARRRWDDLDNFDAAVERAISDVEQPQVRSTLSEEVTFQCIVDYIGAYPYWDIASEELTYNQRYLKSVEDCVDDLNDVPVERSETNSQLVDN